MRKLLAALLITPVVAALLMAATSNFHGRQTINGLGNTQLFTAPVSGPFFIQGNLSLPMLTQGSAANSSARAILYKNDVTQIYLGATGATGFAWKGALAVSDAVKVSISSNASVDQGLNVIKGDVFFGSGL